MHRDNHTGFHLIPQRDCFIQVDCLRRSACWKEKNIDMTDGFQRITIQSVTQIPTVTDPDPVYRETKDGIRPPLGSADIIVVRADSQKFDAVNGVSSCPTDNLRVSLYITGVIM